MKRFLMRPLDQEEIDAVLKDSGFGFLGLAKDDNPYVIPMSFGYDGGALYFQMNSQGRKFDYIEGQSTAVLAVLDLDPNTGVSISILVEGELAEITENEEEPAFETLAANARFGTDLEIWGYPFSGVELTIFKLSPRTFSGRVFGEQMA